MSAPLIDTDVLSEVFKGKNTRYTDKAREYLLLHDQFHFSMISRYEILRGLLAKRATTQVNAFEALCSESKVVGLTEPIARRAAEVWAELRLLGQTPGDADVLIGATALVLGVPVVTRNVRHFQPIPGLGVETWD